MIDFLKEAQEISGELSEIRKTIHRHPELGNQEFKTSALVEAYLNKLGIDTRRILGTAIIGIFHDDAAREAVATRCLNMARA